MSRRSRVIFIAAAALLCGVLMLLGHRWYYVNVTWPKDIQMRTIGQVVVSHAELVERTGFSHLGQGAHRWVYQVGNENPGIRSLCGSVAIRACNWNRRASPFPHVTQDAVFADGKLTLEESWE
jgi:hypothetical protein